MCNEASQLRLPRALQYTYYCTRTFCAANASTETRTSYLLPRTSCRSTSSSTATRCSTRWHRLPSSGGRATRSRSRSRWRWRRRSSSIRPTRRCSAEPQPTGGLYFGVLLHAFSFVGEFSTVTCTPFNLRAPRWRRNSPQHAFASRSHIYLRYETQTYRVSSHVICGKATDGAHGTRVTHRRDAPLTQPSLVPPSAEQSPTL